MHAHYTEKQLKLFTGYMNLYLSEEKETRVYERGKAVSWYIGPVTQEGECYSQKGRIALAKYFYFYFFHFLVGIFNNF